MGQYQGVFESFNPRARDGREVDVADHGKGLAVSIHAPVMDAKKILLKSHTIKRCFNPRARDGRELVSVKDGDPVIGVSIHAPVMDANSFVAITKPPSDVSIHAPVMDANIRHTSPNFNSSFNPRARDGREPSAN